MRLRTQILVHNNCYTVGRTIKPKGIMVHSTGANNPRVSRYVPGDAVLGLNTGGNHWDQTNAQWEEKFGEPLDRCVHAFIGKWADGAVGTVQTLPWNRRGWHCGSGNKGTANNTHISFEICEDGLTAASYFSAVYQEAVELTAYLCQEYGLDPMEGGVVICHSEGYRRGIASNHGDVMHWWPRFGVTMDDFRADVAREMQGGEELTQEQVRQIVREELAAQEIKRNNAAASSWALEYIQRAIQAGILTGVDDGQGGLTIAAPQGNATRQEMATMGVAVLEAVRRAAAGV